MAYKGALGTLLSHMLLFGCGAAAVAAWTGGLYASLALMLLLGLWLATLALLHALPSAVLPEPKPAQGRDSADEIVLRAVLDQAPMPLLTIEGSGRVRTLNRAARALFAVEDVLTDVSDLLRDGAQRLRHAERNYRVDRIEAYGAGAARTILALVNVESEERIAEARATRELLQVLSHEVMNALTPIASLAESALATLDDSAPPGARLREMIGTVSRRAAGLLHFTQAYRTLARLPEPTMAPASLPLLFDDLARMFEARWAGNVALTVDMPPEAIIVMDRDQIGQALWALLQNAAEAASIGRAAPEVHLCSRLDDRLVVQITDNGAGVPHEVRPRIFQPFYTTKAQGSGVGLSLARQIAHAHGGDLRLLGAEGSLFELSLPGPGCSQPLS